MLQSVSLDKFEERFKQIELKPGLAFVPDALNNNEIQTIILDEILKDEKPITFQPETKPRFFRNLLASYLCLIRWLGPDTQNQEFRIYKFLLGGFNFNSTARSWFNLKFAHQFGKQKVFSFK